MPGAAALRPRRALFSDRGLGFARPLILLGNLTVLAPSRRLGGPRRLRRQVDRLGFPHAAPSGVERAAAACGRLSRPAAAGRVEGSDARAAMSTIGGEAVALCSSLALGGRAAA